MALATLTGDEQQTEGQRRMKKLQRKQSSKSSEKKKAGSSQMFGMQPSRRRSGSQCEDVEECLVDDGSSKDEADLSNIDLTSTMSFTTAEILDGDRQQKGMAIAQKQYESDSIEGPKQRTALVPQQAEPKEVEIVQDDRPMFSIRRALTWCAPLQLCWMRKGKMNLLYLPGLWPARDAVCTSHHLTCRMLS